MQGYPAELPATLPKNQSLLVMVEGFSLYIPAPSSDDVPPFAYRVRVGISGSSFEDEFSLPPA